jgi:hypothetical protein
MAMVIDRRAVVPWRTSPTLPVFAVRSSFLRVAHRDSRRSKDPRRPRRRLAQICNDTARDGAVPLHPPAVPTRRRSLW